MLNIIFHIFSAILEIKVSENSKPKFGGNILKVERLNAFFFSRCHYEVNFHWYTQMLFLCKPPQLLEILFDCIWFSFLALTRIIRITLCAHLMVWPLIRQMESSKSVSSEMSAMCQRATWRCLNRNICVTGVVTIVYRLSDVTVVRKAIILCSQNNIRSVIFFEFSGLYFLTKVFDLCIWRGNF